MAKTKKKKPSRRIPKKTAKKKSAKKKAAKPAKKKLATKPARIAAAPDARRRHAKAILRRGGESLPRPMPRFVPRLLADKYDADLERNPANFQPLTPLTFLERAASVFPSRTAIIHGKQRFSYADYYERSRRLASALSKKGLKKGDTVAVMLANTPPMLEAHYGVPMAGGVLNCLNTRLDAPALAFILDHGEAKFLIADREFAAVMKETLKLARSKPLVIDYDDPEFPQSGERLGSLEGRRLAVTRDDSTVFVYVASSLEAESARRAVQAELTETGIEAREITLEHWLADEERWDDEPPGETWEQDELDRGFAPWEVRIDKGTRGEAEDLAKQLEAEGLSVVRSFSYVIVRKVMVGLLEGGRTTLPLTLPSPLRGRGFFWQGEGGSYRRWSSPRAPWPPPPPPRCP